MSRKIKPTLVVMAAGLGSRYGGSKQDEPVGPSGERILDYSVYDAIRSGFGKIVFILQRSSADVVEKALETRFGNRVELKIVCQELENHLSKHILPVARNKPWGTGHAVLEVSEVVNEPFAVMNADDFYGYDAIGKLARFLVDAKENRTGSYSMVGYELGKTLSLHGEVSRGVCQCDDSGMLVNIEEVTGIRKTDHGIQQVSAEGKERTFAGDDLVSMNLWGLHPTIFQPLQKKFTKFLSEHGDDLTSEFYLPQAIGEIIGERNTQVKVLRTESSWFGMTYREDKQSTIQNIEQLIETGEYPENLWC